MEPNFAGRGLLQRPGKRDRNEDRKIHLTLDRAVGRLGNVPSHEDAEVDGDPWPELSTTASFLSNHLRASPIAARPQANTRAARSPCLPATPAAHRSGRCGQPSQPPFLMICKGTAHPAQQRQERPRKAKEQCEPSAFVGFVGFELPREKIISDAEAPPFLPNAEERSPRGRGWPACSSLRLLPSSSPLIPIRLPSFFGRRPLTVQIQAKHQSFRQARPNRVKSLVLGTKTPETAGPTCLPTRPLLL
jgi:hypothetical protein